MFTIAIFIYKLQSIYTRQINNKDLLYSIGKYIQYLVIIYNRKDSDAGRDWGQEEKGMTEDEMAGWYH